MAERNQGIMLGVCCSYMIPLPAMLKCSALKSSSFLHTLGLGPHQATSTTLPQPWQCQMHSYRWAQTFQGVFHVFLQVKTMPSFDHDGMGPYWRCIIWKQTQHLQRRRARRSRTTIQPTAREVPVCGFIGLIDCTLSGNHQLRHATVL